MATETRSFSVFYKAMGNPQEICDYIKVSTLLNRQLLDMINTSLEKPWFLRKDKLLNDKIQLCLRHKSDWPSLEEYLNTVRGATMPPLLIHFDLMHSDM